MKTIVTVLGLLGFMLSLSAQKKFEVSGTFKDEYGQPMPGVSVVVKGTGQGTTTDFDGFYKLFLEEGDYTLVFSFLAPQQIERSFYLNRNKELNVKIGEKLEILDEVLVSAVRVTKESPVTFSNLNKEEIAPRNLGQDIPILLNYLPSVVTTSDAGAGVGYTGIRVRGSDATRVNVTINGIPYNDSESHGTFWVNLPDFASSTESLQLQRGVGTSTNGAGAFGASLNLLTDAFSEDAYAQLSSSIGSFNTLRNNLKFSTGLLNNRIEIAGRLSRITSDGYIDRASSELESYFLQASFKDKNTLVKALLFGGHEITYQSWFGIDAQTLANNRTFNPAGQYTDGNGNTQFYDNEVDNYKQDHFQLHWNEQISDTWSTNLAFHYTRGRGFFEQFREDDDFAIYDFQPINVNGVEVNTTDLIRRRWLDNDFYGTVFSANHKTEELHLIIGGGYNVYKGDHFGEVIWAQFSANSNIRDRYYDDNSRKSDLNLFTKANYKLAKYLQLFTDLQLRTVSYSANGEDTGLVDDSFAFFNPKAGISFNPGINHNLYFSYAIAQREPNRNDYENGNPKPEKLDDFELGWRYLSPSIQINTNIYFMKYKDQLVLTGELNDVGAPLRANVGDSYRLGMEIDARFNFWKHFIWKPNMALSSNKNVDFVFQRDGVLEELGNTNIAYSPGIIIGNNIVYNPSEAFQIGLLTKYVGKQYMGNIDSENSVLEAYSQTDLNIQYQWNTNTFIKNIRLSALLNNVFNAKYVSNGYFFTYDDDFSNPGTITTVEGAGYYPQAGINFLLGAQINF